MRLRHALIVGVMFGMAVGAIWGGGMVAFAQQPQPERTFTLTLPLSEIQYIAGVLQKKPYEEVAVLLNKLQQQVSNQQVAEPTKPTPPAPGTEPKKE